MMNTPLRAFALVVSLVGLTVLADARTVDGKQKLVIVAGKPSHPPRMHEFNAGVQLLAGCLKSVPGLQTEFVLNGWPQDEKVFADADAVVFYMDGGPKHEVVQDGGKRLAAVEEWVKKGVGIGCMHYGVEVTPEQAGEQFKRWIGGFYEGMYSCNPIWEPEFAKFVEHPITRGVKPFQIKDEWYFNMRFADGFGADAVGSGEGVKFWPILVAKPSDAVRGGPYVYPKGPYPHIQAASGRQEAMMWAVERADGGRGCGFTGGHFHDNWGNDDFRKVVLNALVWVAKGEVPAAGIDSAVTKEQLDANLDPKQQPKK
jgi:type 1 glutamine amidotransferase